MPLVGVVPAYNIRGVDAPGAVNPTFADRDGPNPTYDWRAEPGSVDNTARITPALVTHDLTNALTADYDTPSLLSCYVVRGPDGRALDAFPRIRKSGLSWVLSQGYTVTVELFAADVDNAGKRPWTENDRIAAVYRYTREPGIGVYFTPRGLRILQPISRALAAGDESESAGRSWVLGIAARFGFSLTPSQDRAYCDPSCSDWTRLYFLPNAARGGSRYRSPAILIDGMRPVSPPRGVAVVRRGSGAVRDIAGIVFARSPPATYDQLIAALTGPLRVGGYRGERHGIYLSLAGALLGRRVPPEHVPAIVWSVASVAGVASPEHHRRSAIDTVGEWASGRPVRGRAGLPDTIRDAFDVATLRGVSGRRRAAVSVEPIAVAQARLLGSIRNAPIGLTVVQTPCGLGKTTAAQAVALERSASGLRTAIAVPTHEKSIEIVDELRGAGVAVRRVFGQLSLLSDDGSAVCRFADTARHLAAGGQSIAWEFCDGRRVSPCEFRGTCAAYAGRDGPDDARVFVGPHALLPELDRRAGSGLLIVDETPALTTSETITEADLIQALASIDLFEPEYGAPLALAVDAFQRWIATAALRTTLDGAAILADVNAQLLDVAREAVGDPDAGARACVAGAGLASGARGDAPPLRRAVAFAARHSVGLAQQIGIASRVLRVVRDAVVSEPSRVWVDEIVRGTGRRGADVSVDCAADTTEPAQSPLRYAVVTTIPRGVTNALRRDGSVVLLDASAGVHAALYRAVVGYDPPTVAIGGEDLGRVSRTILYTRDAVRSRGLSEYAVLSRFIRSAVTWALSDPTIHDIGIISMLAVERILSSELRRGHGDIYDSLRLLASPPALGHYGALRGLNAFSDLDALITIGDPWPNLAAVGGVASIAGVDGDAYSEALVQAELEQAHGRIRTIHRRRPARLLHVGRVCPGGWVDHTVREFSTFAWAGPPSAVEGSPRAPDDGGATVPRAGASDAASGLPEAFAAVFQRAVSVAGSERRLAAAIGLAWGAFRRGKQRGSTQFIEAVKIYIGALG